MSFAVARFDDADGKRYRPYCWVRSGIGEGWKARSVPAPRPLYNLNKLAARPVEPVLVVEGEKCVRRAEKLLPAWVVVTSPSGANAASKADWKPLQNRHVVIWPDADEPGIGYANDIATILHGLGVSNLRVVDAKAIASRRLDGTTRATTGVGRRGRGQGGLASRGIAQSSGYCRAMGTPVEWPHRHNWH